VNLPNLSCRSRTVKRIKPVFSRSLLLLQKVLVLDVDENVVASRVKKDMKGLVTKVRAKNLDIFLREVELNPY